MSETTIVVGAGSAGGALAARLSEDPDRRIVLIEAGPDYAQREEVPAPICNAYEMSVDGHDWGLTGFFIEPADARDPQPYPRGRLVGGSSAVNAAIAQRGTVADFEQWVAAGNDEWSYEHVLPFFKRVETDLDYGESQVHGGGGPVPIRRFPRTEWSPAARLFEQACLERGFPACDDQNAPGATGVGPLPRNQIGDERASSLLTYLLQARGRTNLEIRSDTTCRRVLFDGTRAVGVEVERGGKVERIAADRVVLCAGAMHTPQLLTLSGVGPRDVLAELGIDPVAVSEGVGQNFQDHPFVGVMGLLKERTPYGSVRAELKFSSELEGGSLDDQVLWATILDPATLNMPVDTRGLQALTIVAQLARPASTGWLRVTSTDVHVQPEIHVNFLSDDGGADLARMMQSVRLAYELATETPIADELDELLFPDRATVADDAALEAWLRGTVTTCYHASATCRMGPDGDPGAVVTQRLAVRGTEGLYVADASVMPYVPTGLTNLTSYMIGERAAAWLRGEIVEPEEIAAASPAG
jgi:choline dehydrogenase